MELQITGRANRHALSAALASLLVLTTQALVSAQGMQGGGGDPNAGNPAIQEPRFRDKMWEAGGPRLSGVNNGKLVTAIEITGNVAVSQHKILSHMQTRADRNFDEKQLQADLHELYRTELFRKITPTIRDVDGGVVVRLEVLEQPTITEVIFHGNQRIDDRMLKKHCGIEVGDPINPFSVDMARQRLVDLYIEKGFNHAAITVREGNKASDRRVYFEISEGQLERISSVGFEGNVIFSDEVLKTKIKTRDSRRGLTRYLFNVANLNTIREDADRLTTYYRSLGYFQARIDYRMDYNTTGDLADVKFVVDEGPQFFVRNISVIGNRFFSSDQLLGAMTLKSGEAFNLGKMSRDQKMLRNEFYGRKGFVFVDIQPEPRFLEEPGQLDLVYKITEGDVYRAGEIHVHIEGDSSHTQHNVVTNMIGLRPGAIIDLRELEDSERRLRFSQIFETNPSQGQEPTIEVRNPDASNGGY